MVAIRALPVLPDSLLARQRRDGEHADCFAIEIARPVTLATFVEAFYTSPAFRPERWLLGLIGRGADDVQAAALARGESTHFAAWSVEARSEREILLRDFQGHTCSWLAVDGSRLCFGSGIRRIAGYGLSAWTRRGVFAALLPFHKIYSRILLRSAANRIGSGRSDSGGRSNNSSPAIK